jgi:hypothetical protein
VLILALAFAQTATLAETSTLAGEEPEIPTEEESPFHFEVGGAIQSNIRYRPKAIGVGEWYARRELDDGISRNEHIFKLKGNAGIDRYSAVVDIDLVWLGFSPEANQLSDLSDREKVESVRIEAQAAYLEAVDLFVDGLDLRVGQQIVAWGVGDQFNPTNTLNADDVEDRLLFGNQQANLMVRLDYSFEDWFTLSGVTVPIFRPALLPSSAALAIAQIDRLPHLDDRLRYRLHSETEIARGMGYPTVVEAVDVEQPKTDFKNMQYMLRLATAVFEQDIALSYYFGRDDFPQPLLNRTRQIMEPRCNPENPDDCIEGLLATSAIVGYPKIQVAGLNLAGEFPVLPIGYRFELGVFFPREQRIRMFQDNIVIAGQTIDGEYDYAIDDPPPQVLDDKPYAKWTLGFDYTFNEYVYLNVQWVHGLVDETGAGDWISKGERVRRGSVPPTVDPFECANPLIPVEERPFERCPVEIKRNTLGDYLVLGVDLRFLSGDLLFRLFGILELTGYVEERFSMSKNERVKRKLSPFSSEGFSAVVFPELNYNFGHGLELGVGGLVFIGKPYTKFGDPAAGGHEIWTRARFSF